MSVAEEIRLIAGAKHGDHTSFETLVERYMGSAMSVAMGYTGNRDDALDLTQEAFYRVFKNLDRFHEGERFAPWFFRILRNACLTFLEKRRRIRKTSIHAREPGDEDYPLPDNAPGPAANAEGQEAQEELWRAFRTLGVKHREIILLRHFEELDYASIAQVLDIPIGTVMSRLFHARQKLKQALEPYMEATP
ncbi:MAG: sigma-70 family RNA polymerase sigma factor [Planctomycetota bacterium]